MNRETKRRKYGENYALYLRNYQRARSRVLTRLAQENPDRYKELLEDEKKKAKRIGKAYASAGWGWSGREWLCLHDLWMRESRWDYLAQNPKSSAFGIAQRLGETSRDPRIQILRGLRYIAHRHLTPCRALSFHNEKGHY